MFSTILLQYATKTRILEGNIFLLKFGISQVDYKNQISNSNLQIPNHKTQIANRKSQFQNPLSPEHSALNTKYQNSVSLSPQLAWYGICQLGTRIKKLTK